MKRKFSTEFKTEAVKLVLEQGLTPAQACRDVGIGSSTLKRIGPKRIGTRPN